MDNVHKTFSNQFICNQLLQITTEQQFDSKKRVRKYKTYYVFNLKLIF